MKKKTKTPFVSICTPTFNRRPFYNMIIHCFQSQTYPKDRMEWVIIDDGTDKIEDIVKDIHQVKYFKYDVKMSLGKKRNLMHEKSKGDIIIYMDDDDFYPPERVSHAVEMLQKNPNVLIAGSSEMYIYFKHIHKMYQFGPYGPNHATAATFAFRKELLKTTSYEEHAALAEEKHFLKNYTIPFIQLDPLKTILVISHEQNTFDKRRLISPDNKQCNESALRPHNFIKNSDLFKFYIEEIPKALLTYEPGNVSNKPDVLAEINRRDNERQTQSQNQPSQVVTKNPDGTTRVLQSHEIIQALQNVTNESLELKKQNDLLQSKLTMMQQIIQRNNLQNFFI